MTVTKALLLYQQFSAIAFWNYKAVCHLAGAKYPASPLGLITMAALLPGEWQLRLLDLNTSTLEDANNLMARYLHFGPQTEFVFGVMAKNIKRLQARAVDDARVMVN
jgi:hypothetical protein